VPQRSASGLGLSGHLPSGRCAGLTDAACHGVTLERPVDVGVTVISY